MKRTADALTYAVWSSLDARASAEWPSQMRPPFFTAAASATSSISAPLIAAMPPMRRATMRNTGIIPMNGWNPTSGAGASWARRSTS